MIDCIYCNHITGKFELYLAVPIDGSFNDVDLSIRLTWMQCCYGHLSGMEIYSPKAFDNLKVSLG